MKETTGAKILLLLLAAAAWLAAGTAARAQMLVMNVSSPSIAGESVISGYEGDVDVASFSFGLGTSVSGSGPGTTVSAPQFSDISIQKFVDKASPTLAVDCAVGQRFGSMTLYTLQSTGNPTLTLTYQIALTNVIVTSVSVSGASSGGRATESVSLHFEKIQWSYYNNAGTLVSQAGYDLSLGQSF